MTSVRITSTLQNKELGSFIADAREHSSDMMQLEMLGENSERNGRMHTSVTRI